MSTSPKTNMVQQMQKFAMSPETTGIIKKYVIPVIGFIVLVVVIFMVYRWYKKTSTNEPLLIKDPKVISDSTTIDGSLAPLSQNGIEYTYSFWMNIKDWKTNLGKPKCILYRSNNTIDDYKFASPSIWLYPNENKLMVRVSTYSGTSYDTSSYPTYPVDKDTTNSPQIVNPQKWTASEQTSLFNSQYVCDVSNIPLQKWVHICVVLFNRTMDVYVNGKLVRSCTLPGIPVHDDTTLSKIYVGQKPTYNGYISKLKYFNRAVTPDEVFKLYNSGPYSSGYWFNDVKANLKLSLNLEGN